MKPDLNRIKAALQQLEQNPSSSDRASVTSQRDTTADKQVSKATSKPPANPTSSAPIPPLQPNRKAPTLPTFDSLDTDNNLSNEEKAPDLPSPPPVKLVAEVQQVIQQIEILYMEGPIVDGWLESYPCEPTLGDDEMTVNDFATPVEYVKAAGSLEQDRAVWEAPRSCYRLNGVSVRGQQWSHPCPLDQLASVSVAIARYEKLLQLLARKRDLETNLKAP
jgi:hypothetical protein